MTLNTSSSTLFLEKHISRIPALQLLQNLGYVFLRPQDAHLERKGRLSNVLLEDILESQLRRLNRVRYKGIEREFTDTNIRAAIEALKKASPGGDPAAASRRVYDLLTLGKTLEQTIEGDTKSYPLRYVDWQRPERNLFHAVEEFEVQSPGSREWRALDIVLFVNGIPFAVIECRRPDEKNSIRDAIAQQVRNQQADQFPRLFAYAQLLLALDANEAAYGATGAEAGDWTRWREDGLEDEIRRLANRPLTRQQKLNLYAGRGYLRQYFDELEMEERPATGQDVALFCLCRPARLLELARQFILFNNEGRQIARHQQYFAVRQAIERINQTDEEGRRRGGLIWQASGSGKSGTMVLLTRAIALDPAFRDPRFVVVTDRGGLDARIRDAIQHGGRGGTALARAATESELLDLLAKDRAAVIAATSEVFETPAGGRDDSSNVFALVDESAHGSVTDIIARVQQVMPNACCLGFTGTPLSRRDKAAADAFGGLLHTYSIEQAVRDGAIAPLVYESRRSASLAEARIRSIAQDLSEHFSRNVAPPFNAILLAESEAAARQYKDCLDEFGQVASELLGQPVPNLDSAQIFIAADHLPAEFDASQTAVLYLDRRLEAPALLQTIARLNRVREGKAFGYILDYAGALANPGDALDLPAALPDFDPDDMRSLLRDMSEEYAKLPQRHAELWELFAEPRPNAEDSEAFERLLGPEPARERFYERFHAYHCTLRVALSAARFFHDTSSEQIERYKQDLRDFQRLRMRIKHRYADEVDFPEDEAGLQKLIEAHGDADEPLRIAPLLNLFDREAFRAELDSLATTAAKADTIAHRTRMTIAGKMEEDPFFYRRLSRTLSDAMEGWREGQIADAAYLQAATEVMNAVLERAGDELPPALQPNDAGRAFYGVVRAVFEKLNPPPPDVQPIAMEAALEIERLIREHQVVDWLTNTDVQNEIRNRIDDYLYELKARRGLNLRLDEMDAIVERALAIAKTQ